MAQILLRPARMTDGKAAWVLKRLSPGDLGLAFEELHWEVQDEKTGSKLKIAGWWIPHEHARGRTVILIHGYADAKVGSIAWAPTFHNLDWNVLAIDLRAHGESGGKFCTAGYFERHDVTQVLSQLHASRPDDLQKVVLFGASLGAAVAVAAAVLESTDIDGVILECPYPDYHVAASSHARALGAPGGLIERWAYAAAAKISGAYFPAVRPLDTIPRIACPLMIIQSEDDIVFTKGEMAAVESAARSRPPDLGSLVYWRVENAFHLTAIFQDPVEYQRRVGEFLELVASDGRTRGAAPCPGTPREGRGGGRT